jgi:hypothetical protein
MKVEYKNNTLTVVTGISEDTIKKTTKKLVAMGGKDNKDEVYAVGFNKCGAGSIDKYGMVGNAFVDGNLAVVQVLPAETTLEDVQRTYGDALLAADKYTDIIATEYAANVAAVAALFE